MNKQIEFSELFVGMQVQDKDGNIGTVKDCKNIHNIHVEYDNGGSGLHCLIEGCFSKTTINGQDVEIPHYDPLYETK